MASSVQITNNGTITTQSSTPSETATSQYLVGKVIEYAGNGIALKLDGLDFFVDDHACYLKSEAEYNKFLDETNRKIINDTHVLQLSNMNYIQSRLLQYRFRLLLELSGPDTQSSVTTNVQLTTHCCINFSEYFTALNILVKNARIHVKTPRPTLPEDRIFMSKYIIDKFGPTDPVYLCYCMVGNPSIFELYINVLDSIATFKTPINRSKQSKRVRYEHSQDVKSEMEYFLSLQLNANIQKELKDGLAQYTTDTNNYISATPQRQGITLKKVPSPIFNLSDTTNSPNDGNTSGGDSNAVYGPPTPLSPLSPLDTSSPRRQP